MSYTLLGGDGRRYESAEKGQCGGHKRTRIYGRLDCPAALRAIARGGYARQRVFFRDEATAIAAGYRPCAVCCKDRYDAWKATRPSGAAGAAQKARGNRFLTVAAVSSGGADQTDSLKISTSMSPA